MDRTDAYRATLDGLLEERAAIRARDQKITAALEAISDLLGVPVPSNGTKAPVVTQPEPLPATQPESAPATPAAVPSSDYPTIGAAAEQVLREAGRHMRALPITRRMLELNLMDPAGDPKVLRASVGGVLARKARKKDVFTKPRSGLFGLLEWNGQGPNESEESLLTALAESEAEGDTDEELEEASADHDES